MKLLFTFLFFVLPALMYSQGSLKIYPSTDKNTLEISEESQGEFKELLVLKDKNDKDADGINIELNHKDLLECKNNDTVEKNIDNSVFYKVNCQNKTIKFYLKGQEEESEKVWFCKKADNYRFYTSEGSYEINCQSEDSEKTSSANTEYKDIIEIPYPRFDSYKPSDSFSHKRNRTLVINANPNPDNNVVVQLRKKKTKIIKTEGNSGADENGKSYTVLQSKEAKAVNINGNMAVFLKNYDTSNIEELKVVIDGIEYKYNKGLQDVLDGAKTEQQPPTGDKGQPIGSGDLPNKRVEYLQNVKDHFETLDALSKNDIARLQLFKNRLEKTLRDNNLPLDEKGQNLLSEILSWSPKYVGLTPIPPAIEDKDEIIVKIITKFSGKEEEEVVVGRYRTIGGMSFDLGGAFFVTGLRNNEVFTETVDVEGEEEKRAFLNNENQVSVGYGLNAELGFRIGSILRPTINVAAFVPFDEEITPYITLGPGISLQSQKVKFSLMGGVALGSINSIKNQYQGTDLSDIQDLTNTVLTEKSWESSWFLGVGIRYLFKEEQDE